MTGQVNSTGHSAAAAATGATAGHPHPRAGAAGEEITFTALMDRLVVQAEAGNVDAMLELGKLHAGFKVNGFSLPEAERDFAQAIEWFTKAANAGNVDAMFSLAGLFYDGKVSGNQADPAKRDLMQAFYWYRQYSIKDPVGGIKCIRTLNCVSEPLVYHLLCVASPNFMAPGALAKMNDDVTLKLIIEGLCQYEDNRLTPQDQRFEMLKTIIDKDEKYFDHAMVLMPVQEKDLFQNYLMRQKKVQLRYKVISSIVGLIPDQGHGLVPELKIGSVHQKMRTEDYIIMLANLRVEMAENARTQVLSRNDGDGVITLSQVLATRMQNKIVKDILRKCLESIQGVLLYNPQDENLLGSVDIHN